MLNSEIISIIFRAVNFGIVVFTAIYLYKKYFAKSIKESISEKKKYFANLLNAAIRLKENSALLDEQIKEQDIKSNEFLEKVDKWRSSYEIELNNQKDEQKLLNEKIERKLEKQEELITLSYFNKIVLPEVFVDTTEKLKKEFDSKANVKEFQNEIIQFMKQS